MGKVRKLKGKKVSSTVQSTQHLRVLINKKNQKKKNSVYFEIFSCTFKNQELPLRTLSYSWIYRKLVALLYVMKQENYSYSIQNHSMKLLTFLRLYLSCGKS